MASAEATADNAVAPVKPKGRKTLAIGALVAVLVAGGAAAWWMMRPAPPAAGEAQAAPPRKASSFVPLDPFTVNLHSDDSDHYLQVGMTLEVDDSSLQPALTEAMPVLRGKLLLLLSSQKAEELLKIEGKMKLAEAVADTTRTTLGERGKGVLAVHFSSFVIQ